MKTWKYGNISIWPHEHIEIWILDTWRHGDTWMIQGRMYTWTNVHIETLNMKI